MTPEAAIYRLCLEKLGTRPDEAGALPTEKDLAAMSAFNQELARAGVLLAGEGLHPNSRGVALQFSDGKRIQRVKRVPFDGGVEA